MKLCNMTHIPDEDMGLMFWSVSYWAVHSSEFKAWCEEHCRGEWGFELQPLMNHFIGDSTIFHAWLYDDQDAMLFKLAFA